MHHAPLLYDQQIFTPSENPNQQTPSKKEMHQKKKAAAKDPLSILTPQKKQTHLHIIHKSQKDTNSQQHPQRYNKSKKNLSSLISMLLQLITYHQSSKYSHQTHPNSQHPQHLKQYLYSWLTSSNNNSHLPSNLCLNCLQEDHPQVLKQQEHKQLNLHHQPMESGMVLHPKSSWETKARVTNSSENFDSIGCSMKKMKQ